MNRKRPVEEQADDRSTTKRVRPSRFSSKPSEVMTAAAKAAAVAAKLTASTSTHSSSLTNAAAASRGPTDSSTTSLSERAAQMKKSIQEQMKNMKAHLNTSRNPLVMHSVTSQFRPAPLCLDDEGRQIDPVTGNVIEEKIVVTKTMKVNAPGRFVDKKSSSSSSSKNKQPQAPTKVINPYLAHHDEPQLDSLTQVDPRLRLKSSKQRREKKGFSFIQAGTFVKQGEDLRSRTQETVGGKIRAGYESGRNPNTKQIKGIATTVVEEEEEPMKKMGEETEENTPLSLPERVLDRVPDVEWWDLEFLTKDQKELFDRFGFLKQTPKVDAANTNVNSYYDHMKFKCCGSIHLIQHPAQIMPSNNNVLEQNQHQTIVPLMLTKREQKRIRRTNRLEREKEKQDKIAIGLLPKPEAKLKLSNMMRVLQETAIADPSAVERKVRQQVADRLREHEARNAAKKCSPAARRDKTKHKLEADASGDIHVALFRVSDLSHPKHKFKVDVNAQQLMLTGGVLQCKEPRLNLVVVEGGPKSIKSYVKLMTRRMDWSQKPPDEPSTGTAAADMMDVSHAQGPEGIVNTCDLVWQGIVARRAFNSFRFQDCRTASTARKVMEAKHVAHYWDQVVHFKVLD